jgi:hypothetical protein
MERVHGISEERYRNRSLASLGNHHRLVSATCGVFERVFDHQVPSEGYDFQFASRPFHRKWRRRTISFIRLSRTGSSSRACRKMLIGWIIAQPQVCTASFRAFNSRVAAALSHVSKLPNRLELTTGGAGFAAVIFLSCRRVWHGLLGESSHLASLAVIGLGNTQGI